MCRSEGQILWKLWKAASGTFCTKQSKIHTHTVWNVSKAKGMDKWKYMPFLSLIWSTEAVILLCFGSIKHRTEAKISLYLDRHTLMCGIRHSAGQFITQSTSSLCVRMWENHASIITHLVLFPVEHGKQFLDGRIPTHFFQKWRQWIDPAQYSQVSPS